MSSYPVIKSAILSVVLLSGLCLAQNPQDPNGPAFDPNGIKLELNFQDVPIQTILEFLSEKAGVVILSDNGLDRRLTVISRRPLGLDDTVALINSVVKDAGFAAVRTGRTLRIVSLEMAKQMNLPVTSGADPSKIQAGDNVVTHIIPIKYAQAAQLKENLLPLLPEFATLEANEETNTLIMTDTTANIKRILEIIRALDTHMSAVSEIKVFPLNKADATTTAELVNQIFQDQAQSSSRRSSGGRGGMMEMFMRGRGGPGGDRGRGDDRGGSNGATAAKGAVNAAADERTNSVVVSAPSEKLVLIEEVIRALDTRTPSIADVKVFHLNYADAENTAELINEVFGLESRSRSSQNQRGGFMSFMGRGGPRGGDDSQGTGSSAVDVVAAADQRTNSVVVSGPPETLAVIADIIKQLDENPEQERNLFVYALKNADATNLMTILNNLFEQIQALNQQGTGSGNQRFQGGGPGGRGGPGGDSGGGSTGAGGSSSDLDEETYFEADTETNSLLVMTSTKNYERIKPIIAELDKPVGQVLIKVLFAELTHSDGIDLGVEFSMLNLNRRGNASTMLRQDPTSTLYRQGSTATDSSWLNPPLEGLSVTSITGDLTATIRALQESGRLNVLSRPYILTRNNQTATITVGQQVPVATGESISTAGSQTITDYNDVGIILEVTPSINPDGLVNMDIRPEISTITGDSVAVSNTLTLPVFSTRVAETQVAVENGHTIVIGGLIQDEVKDNVSKIPLLGDLPLVGALFRHTTKETSKIELLIFLTPIVAPEPNDLIAISDSIQDQTKINKDESAADIYQSHMDAMKTQVNTGKAIKEEE